MTNKTRKNIIKYLANAPAIAAREVLQTLDTEEERDEARRIFSAVGITPAETDPARAHLVNVYERKTGELFARYVFPNRPSAEKCADNYNATEKHRASLQPVTGQILTYYNEKTK